LANKILFPSEEQRKIFQGTNKEDGASKKGLCDWQIKYFFQMKGKERFFKGPVKKMGQAKRIGAKRVKVLCGRLYMLGM
jgi:hypothetical protein